MKVKEIFENDDVEEIQAIIDKEDYEGIRDQDGWETLVLTVTNAYPNESKEILKMLRHY